MKAFVATGGLSRPGLIRSGLIRRLTCVVGELEDGSRMATLAKWRDGAIAEYIWI